MLCICFAYASNMHSIAEARGAEDWRALCTLCLWRSCWGRVRDRGHGKWCGDLQRDGKISSGEGREGGISKHRNIPFIVKLIRHSCVSPVCVSYFHFKKQAATVALTQVGVLKVRLFRPWDRARFMAALPTTAKRVCVLDRTKDRSWLECESSTTQIMFSVVSNCL